MIEQNNDPTYFSTKNHKYKTFQAALYENRYKKGKGITFI